MAKRIITISREFGSGGRFIGEETAKKLGIDYYDKDIIGQIAIQSGLLQEYIRGSLNCSGFLGSHTDKFHVKLNNMKVGEIRQVFSHSVEITAVKCLRNGD